MTANSLKASLVLAIVIGTVLLMALGKLDHTHWATVVALFVRSPLDTKGDGEPPKPGGGIPLPIFLTFVAALAVTQACTPVTTPAAAEAAYTAEQLACVDKSETREASRACRAEVDKRWGVPRDAGKD